MTDCGEPLVGHGYCLLHYNRFRRTGDPEGVRVIVGDPVRRFWAKVDKDGPVPEYRSDLGPCWLWTGAPNEWGYGSIRWGGPMRAAHRVAYELEHGAVPPALDIDHLCRVPACVRPSHLESVTPAENQRRRGEAQRADTSYEQVGVRVPPTVARRLAEIAAESGRLRSVVAGAMLVEALQELEGP